MRPRITVIKESNTGRNELFHDNYRNINMTSIQFVKQIEKGNYHEYHVREINKIKTPVSNPDNKKNNNLG